MTVPCSPTVCTGFQNGDLYQIYSAADALGSAVTTLTSNCWSILGNSSLDSTINFLGTTDAKPIIFKYNSVEKLRILNGYAAWTVPVNNTSTYGFMIGSQANKARVEHSAGTFEFVNTSNSVANISVTGIKMGAVPTANNAINMSSSVAGRYGILITNSNSGASAGAYLRLGNNNQQSSIWQASSGATTASGLYAYGMNFVQDDLGGFIFNEAGPKSSGAYTRFRITSGTSGAISISNQTASTEIPCFYDMGFTMGHATGNYATQRDRIDEAVTHTFTAASTITSGYGRYIQKPVAGTNAVITNIYGIGTNGNISMEGGILYGTTTANFLQLDNGVGSKLAYNSNNYWFVGNTTSQLNLNGGAQQTWNTSGSVLTGSLSFSTNLINTAKTINVTSGDAATINSISGRFRKDASGTQFIVLSSELFPSIDQQLEVRVVTALPRASAAL